MKKILLICIGVILLGTSLASAQQFHLRGLEIYNPYYHNPAYLQAEKTVQLDFIGYNFYLNSGIWSSANINLPKINSSAGIRFESTSYTDIGDAWNLQLAYAYQHSFSEDLHLNGGMLFSSGHIDYEDGRFVTNEEELSKRHAGTLGLGVSVEYKKLHAGLSTSLPLYRKKEVIQVGDGSTDTQKEDADNYSIHFISGYSFGLPWKLTLDPIVGLDYFISNGGEFHELQGYLGANLEFRNLVGLGFTLGNLVSVSTSVNIMDRVSLILGIYAGEHDLFGEIQGRSYTIGSNDFDIIGQIRINL